MSRKEEIKRSLYEQTIAGDAGQVRALTEEGIGRGIPALDLLFGALMPALQEVGRRFERRDVFVPEMLIAAKAMHVALALLRPLLAQTDAKPLGTVVMLTVKGDLHDIGKNLCNIMLEGAGFTVVDLGINVPVERVVAAVREHRPALVGLSAFLTTTMPVLKLVTEALAREGLRDALRVMVGGAPVTPEYAAQIGADGYARDASATVRLAKRLLRELGHDVPEEAEAPAGIGPAPSPQAAAGPAVPITPSPREVPRS